METSGVSSWFVIGNVVVLPLRDLVEDFLRIIDPLLGLGSSAWEGWRVVPVPFLTVGGEELSSLFSTASWCLRKRL